MKKFLLILSVLAVMIPAVQLRADDDDNAPKRLTTAERKAAIKELVETRENGDVVIRKNPAVDDKLKSKAGRVPGYLMDLMLHVDPNLDFEKFNKIAIKYLGESGSRTGSGVVGAADEYLGTVNMRLKLVKFQPNN